jgi:hypothetical protein
VYIVKRYVYLRLYRILDEPIERIKEELNELGEFIKTRAEQKRDITYITLTYISRKRVDGLITLAGEDFEELEKEREIILGYIESRLETITAEKIDKPKIRENLPIPTPPGFFGGNPA